MNSFYGFQQCSHKLGDSFSGEQKLVEKATVGNAL